MSSASKGGQPVSQDRAGSVHTSTEAAALSQATMGRYRSKPELVFELLRDSILDNELKSGQRIVIDDLVRRLGVSAIPIREALSQLASEGLVELVPHVGARVARRPSPSELTEILAVRHYVEEMVVDLAAKKITKEEIAHLRQTLGAMEEGADTVGRTQWHRLHRDFHRTIYAASRNITLAEVCSDLFVRSARGRVDPQILREMHPTENRQHHLLIDALEQGDIEAAKRVVREHGRNWIEYILPRSAPEDQE